MRSVIAFAFLLALAACGPQPVKPVSTLKQLTKAEGLGAMWPVMLQHCLRDPACDPAGDFGDGAGEASDMVGDVMWFAQTKDKVKEGGADYGGRILLNFTGFGGTGGEAGRPMTLDEVPSSLSAQQQRTTWLTIEYRQPGDKSEPYFFALRTAALALSAHGLEKDQAQETKAQLTGDYIAGLDHGDGETTGLKVEIVAGKKTVFTGYSIGLSAGMKPEKGTPAWAFDPWHIYVSANLRDEADRLAPVMKAIRAGEPLGVRITDPHGRVALETGIGTKDAAEALKAAEAALADPLIATPLAERCRPVLFGNPKAQKTPATLCDDRTTSMRAAEEARKR